MKRKVFQHLPKFPSITKEMSFEQKEMLRSIFEKEWTKIQSTNVQEILRGLAVRNSVVRSRTSDILEQRLANPFFADSFDSEKTTVLGRLQRFA